MEWYINALEWDDCEAALKLDWLWLSLSFSTALANDLDEVLLDILEGHLGHQVLDIDLLQLQRV